MKYILTRQGRKKYLSELIGDGFRGWNGKKVMISAPTGIGKSTFVTEILLNDVKNQKRRGMLLILCNRRLLRLQYWYNLVQRFECYNEIDECIRIMTYQELAEMMKWNKTLDKVFDGVEMIVCDECHYFYSDSDFNGYGTYALLQEIVCKGARRTILFMSATMDKVAPLISQTIVNGLNRQERTGRNEEITNTNKEIVEYDFSEFADYDRFRCIYVPDWESLCEVLARSSKKSILFLNNKEKAAALSEQLIKTGKIEKKDIAILNADNMDCESELIQQLVIGNKLLVKCLITTAVLDNGVSIQDPEVGNVIIETESKIEFLQMLGRVRAESVDVCRLYFVKRDGKDFLKRKNKYEEEVKWLDKITTSKLRVNRNYYLQSLWDGDREAEFYRKVLVWMKFDSQSYVWPENEARRCNLDADLYVNEFAKCKIRDMYLAESRFYSAAVSDPLKVVHMMMAWMNKEPDELDVMESEYQKRHEQEFISRLLSVQKFTLEQLKEFKQELVIKYHKSFFDEIPSKNKTISNDKLSMICKRYGMKLITEESDRSRRTLYTIQFAQEEEEEE